MPKKKNSKKTSRHVVEKALDERVSEILGLPNVMRLASAPTPIWIGAILSWMPVDVLLERRSHDGPDGEVWLASCGELEAEGWSITVAACRLILLINEQSAE